MFKPVQTQDLRLTGSGISSGATSITVQELVKPGTTTTITMSDFGSIGYGVIEPGTPREENFSFTGVTQNANGTATFTGCTTGIDFVSPYSSSATLKYNHAGNSLVRISNTAAFYSEFAFLENDQTFTGINTFPASGGANAPRTASTAVAPALDEEYATKKYVDDTAIAGAPDATTDVKGIVEIATQAEVDAGTATGGTGASVVVRPPELANVIQDGSYIYAADSVGTDSYAITLTPAITAYVTGQMFNFKAGTANTAACTLNVNGLGAKDIKKNHDQALETGDIEVGSIVTVVYDGTNFQMQNTSAGSMATSVVSQLSTGISANVTGTNLATLTAGAASDADALHTHAEIGTLTNYTPNTSIGETWHTYEIPLAGGVNYGGWTGANASAVGIAGGGPYTFSSSGYLVTKIPDIGTGTADYKQWDSSKDTRIKCFAGSLDGAATYNTGLGFVDSATDLYAARTSNNRSIRFCHDSTANKFYAVTATGAANTNTDIDASFVNSWSEYAIVINPGVDAKFYINGTLVATHTTNLPTSNNEMLFGVAQSNGAGGGFYFSQPTVSLEK